MDIKDCFLKIPRTIDIITILLVLYLILLGLPTLNNEVKINSLTQTANLEITLVGHGLGHGIGMGQWGAIGEAYLGHTTYQDILNYYYSPAQLTSLTNEPPTVKVYLSSLGTGPYYVYLPNNFYLNSKLVGSQVLEIKPVSSGFDIYSGSSCSSSFTFLQFVNSATIAQAIPDPYGSSSLLYVCSSNGLVPYHGELLITYLPNGNSGVVNTVATEAYVQDVLPAEMPADWGTFGSIGWQNEPAGFQALEAQAVAIRSYVLSLIGSLGFADICDSSYCQEYPGASDENPISNLATQDTNGQVMEYSNGVIATTFYSASTGGYTAGGPFNAVPDPFDSICNSLLCNPNHSWTVSLSASQIQTAFPQIGQFKHLDILSRNGYGDMGGRVLEVDVVGATSSVSVTGYQFASLVGLNSDWFGYQIGNNLQVGYYVTTSANNYSSGIFSFGDVGPLNFANVVAFATDPTGSGGWVLTSSGALLSFGQAPNFLETQNIPTSNVASIVPEYNGQGLWIIYQNGQILSFGQARPLGFSPELIQQCINCYQGQPITQNIGIKSVAASLSAQGFWALSSAFGLIGLGNVKDFGLPLKAASGLVSICAVPSGNYLFGLTSSGEIITIGDGPQISLNSPLPSGQSAIAIACTSDGKGALVLDTAGNVTPAGDASFWGSPTEDVGVASGVMGIYIQSLPTRPSPAAENHCLGQIAALLTLGRTCLFGINYKQSNLNPSPVAVGSLIGVGLYKKLIIENYKEVQYGSP